MQQPQWLADGGIRVPHAAMDPATGAILDGMVTVYPGDDLYALWARWLVEHEQPADGRLT